MTLPTPDPAFHWTAEAWGHALRCRPLAAVAQHAFTTRQLELRPTAGRSREPLPNAASAEQRDAQDTSEAARGTRAPATGASGEDRTLADARSVAWTQATASVGAGLEQLIRVKQVHGATVRVLRKGETGPRDVADRPDADAMISNATGFVLSVQVADCLPILIADDRTGSVAAIHAGWRGTCAGVARAAVEAMTRELGAQPSDLIAAIGPSIGACCYEVGPDVLDAFRLVGAGDADIDRWFAHTEAGSLRLDLWAANHDQLIACGMRDDRLHICRLCTETHRDIFDSYRADGARAGRTAALIVVP